MNEERRVVTLNLVQSGMGETYGKESLQWETDNSDHSKIQKKIDVHIRHLRNEIIPSIIHYRYRTQNDLP